ncbi:MAG: hypothetical protein RSD95_12210 [Clostridia bacterium]
MAIEIEVMCLGGFNQAVDQRAGFRVIRGADRQFLRPITKGFMLRSARFPALEYHFPRHN